MKCVLRPITGPNLLQGSTVSKSILVDLNILSAKYHLLQTDTVSKSTAFNAFQRFWKPDIHDAPHIIKAALCQNLNPFRHLNMLDIHAKADQRSTLQLHHALKDIPHDQFNQSGHFERTRNYLHYIGDTKGLNRRAGPCIIRCDA